MFDPVTGLVDYFEFVNSPFAKETFGFHRWVPLFGLTAAAVHIITYVIFAWFIIRRMRRYERESAKREAERDAVHAATMAAYGARLDSAGVRRQRLE